MTENRTPDSENLKLHRHSRRPKAYLPKSSYQTTFYYSTPYEETDNHQFKKTNLERPPDNRNRKNKKINFDF